MKGVIGIVDVIFVYGVIEEEYDVNIVKFMIRFKERGIKFNKDK